MSLQLWVRQTNLLAQWTISRGICIGPLVMFIYKMTIPVSPAVVKLIRCGAVGKDTYIGHDIFEDMPRPRTTVLDSRDEEAIWALKWLSVCRVFWRRWDCHCTAAFQQRCCIGGLGSGR